MIMATEQYPLAPGYKTLVPETSAAAAASVAGRSERLCDLVLEELAKHENLTTDECAKLLGETPFSIRPRFSQLRTRGKVEPSKVRRKNASGCSAAAWQLIRRQTQPELRLV